jgi:hypothetical protein
MSDIPVALISKYYRGVTISNFNTANSFGNSLIMQARPGAVSYAIRLCLTPGICRTLGKLAGISMTRSIPHWPQAVPDVIAGRSIFTSDRRSLSCRSIATASSSSWRLLVRNDYPSFQVFRR